MGKEGDRSETWLVSTGKQQMMFWGEISSVCSIFVRLRPCSVGEATSLIPRCDKSLAFISGQESSEYHFDAVLPQGTSQRLVFERVCHLVDFAKQGKRAAIISYGQARLNNLNMIKFYYICPDSSFLGFWSLRLSQPYQDIKSWRLTVILSKAGVWWQNCLVIETPGNNCARCTRALPCIFKL